MQSIYANHATSVTEFKKNPTKIISQAEGEPVAILNHNTATAYLIPAETFEKLIEALDEHNLIQVVKKRLTDNKKSVKVGLDDL